jgi:hypothetical protein
MLDLFRAFLTITCLDCANVCVLADVLVLVQGILGQLSLLLFDGLLHEQNHNRLQGRDGHIAGSLGCLLPVRKKGRSRVRTFVLQYVRGEERGQPATGLRP